MSAILHKDRFDMQFQRKYETRLEVFEPAHRKVFTVYVLKLNALPSELKKFKFLKC